MLGKKSSNLLSANLQLTTRFYDYATIWCSREFSNGALKRARVAYIDGISSTPMKEQQIEWRQIGRCLPLWSDLAGPARGHTGCDLFEQSEPFPTDAILENGKTSRIAAGPCQAGHETTTHGINSPTKTIGMVEVAC